MFFLCLIRNLGVCLNVGFWIIIVSRSLGESSITEVTLNFINVVVGAGLLGFPYAAELSGYVSIVLISLFLIILTEYSIHILVQCGVSKGTDNYEDLVKKLFGSSGYIFILFIFVMYEFGTTLAYLIIIGDLSVDIYDSIFETNREIQTAEKMRALSEGMQQAWLLNTETEAEILANQLMIRRVGISVIGVFVLWPLCSFDNLAKLEKFSFVSIVATVLMMLMCLYFLFRSLLHDSEFAEIDVMAEAESLVDDSHSTSSSQFVAFGNDPYTAFGILAFTFVCHDSCFLMFQTLKHPTERRWAKVTRYSLVGSFVLSVGVGLVGYFTFGEETKQDILRNYEVGLDLPVILTRVLYLVALALTYPISFFVCRHICFRVVAVMLGEESTCETVREGIDQTEGDMDEQSELSKPSSTRFHVVTTGLLFANILCSLFIRKAGVPMSLNGNICAVTLAFIFPPLCALKVCKETKQPSETDTTQSSELTQPLLKESTEERDPAKSTSTNADFGTFGNGKASQADQQEQPKRGSEDGLETWSTVPADRCSVICYYLILVFGVVSMVFCSYQTIKEDTNLL